MTTRLSIYLDFTVRENYSGGLGDAISAGLGSTKQSFGPVVSLYAKPVSPDGRTRRKLAIAIYLSDPQYVETAKSVAIRAIAAATHLAPDRVVAAFASATAGVGEDIPNIQITSGPYAGAQVALTAPEGWPLVQTHAVALAANVPSPPPPPLPPVIPPPRHTTGGSGSGGTGTGGGGGGGGTAGTAVGQQPPAPSALERIFPPTNSVVKALGGPTGTAIVTAAVIGLGIVYVAKQRSKSAAAVKPVAVAANPRNRRRKKH